MAVFGCVGCATDLSEEMVVTTPQDVVLTVNVASPKSKVSLGDKESNGGYKVYWDEGDRISANGNISEVADINESNGGSAQFEFKGAILNYHTISSILHRRAIWCTLPRSRAIV